MRNILSKTLDAIERVGNKLPDPVTLFFLLVVLVIVSSVIASAFDVGAIHPLSGEAIKVSNLLSGTFIKRILIEMPETFMGFAPLGLVLVVMLGVGVAEHSGLIGASLKSVASAVPQRLLTVTLVFAGIMASIAADAGYVVLIPLGAVLFLGFGRHPIAGIAATFAGVSAGFTANLLPGTLDVLLGGLSTESAQILDASYEVSITANYYLMVALVPILTIIGTVVTEYIVEPRLGAFTSDLPGIETREASSEEQKGLRWAKISFLLFLIFFAWMSFPSDAMLRSEDGGFEPLFKSLVGILFLFFLILGIAFGIGAGKIKSDKDVVKMMSQSMSDMALYIVLAFFAAHFIALFSWSNLGLVLAINGANWIKDIGFQGTPLLIVFIAFTSFINLFIGSASAKWGMLGPVFIPMFMLLGMSPELTQAAYRLGDSATNIITPLMPYFPLIIVFARRYVPDFQIGSLISIMLPYSIAFWIGGVVLLFIFMTFGLPIGPGIPTSYVIP